MINFNVVGKYEETEILNELRKEIKRRKDDLYPIKGIMITGPEGSGKSTLLKDFLDSFKCKKVTFDHMATINHEYIRSIFEEVEDEEEAILYIDDFDMHYARDFMYEFSKADSNVLVIATRQEAIVNEKYDPYLFNIDGFNEEVILSNIDIDMVRVCITGFFEHHNLELNPVDLYHVINRFTNSNYQELQETLELAYSSKGDKLKVTDLYPGRPNKTCLCRCRELDRYYGDVSYKTCISEAARIVYANSHLENTQFTECYFKDYSHMEVGIYHYEACVNRKDIKYKRFDYPYLQETKIKIAMAGYLNELLNFKSFNGDNAIKHKRIINDNLDEIVKYCYMDPIYNSEAKHIEINKVSYTNADNKHVLKLKHKLFKKYEKETTQWLKDNQEQIKRVADHLYKLKEMTFADYASQFGFGFQGQEEY